MACLVDSLGLMGGGGVGGGMVGAEGAGGCYTGNGIRSADEDDDDSWMHNVVSSTQLCTGEYEPGNSFLITIIISYQIH